VELYVECTSGFPQVQKGRDINASQGKHGKGQGAVLAKKRAICVVQGKTLKMRKTARISLLFLF
jgi:hypothetical protein